jgi:hypothetical protein
MAYSIRINVINNTSDTLAIVEKTTWYYTSSCEWSEFSGGHLLSMGGSGTSGMIRFKSSNGEQIGLVTGVHNYKRWCDLVVNIENTGADKSTSMYIHPTYYQPGTNATTREKQLSSVVKTTAKGKRVTAFFYVDDGNNLYAVFTYN